MNLFVPHLATRPPEARKGPARPTVAPGAFQRFSKAFAGFSKPVCRALAANARAGRELAALLIGVATNADVPAIASEPGDGWLLLAPYGDTDYWHQEDDGKWQRYTQVFGQPQAAKMVSAFNAALGKRGARFRGLPVYRGHPDADPKRWPDEGRLGGIMAMDARADGLYVRAAWNDLGQANLAQGYLVYPSPAWLYDMRAAKRTGRIEPDELRSVGLTNSPRIADVDAWTNSDANLNQPTAEDTMIRKLLTKMLGLAETATEDEIQTAFNAHFSGDVTAISLQATATNAAAALTTAEGQVTTLTTERDAARTEAADYRALAVNAVLDNAINTGRISAAERPGFVTQFAANHDAATAALAARRPALPSQPIEVRRVDENDLSTGRARSLAYNSRVDALMGEKRLTFEQANSAMHQDPEGKRILAAMKKADEEAAAKAK